MLRARSRAPAMSELGRRRLARLIAPLALIVVAAALLAILMSASSDDTSKGKSSEPERTTTAAKTTTAKKAAPARSSYTVKTGDTLGGIAEKTGRTVEQLQELNPELDPQALVSGQKIKLRE